VAATLSQNTPEDLLAPLHARIILAHPEEELDFPYSFSDQNTRLEKRKTIQNLSNESAKGY
tara:strand:+ start:685 stop:867 length:183 start_codon:yes stop_codon:yes gene_type:complete